MSELSTSPPPSLLVVDDNEGARYATARILKNAGFELREASSASQCWELLAQRPPDLLLLDVNLPDANGIDICRAIKSRRDTQSIPVVHISASSLGLADKIRGLETGADAYITEPYEPAVLVSTIRALLRTREAEKRVRRILDSITDGFLVLDSKWRILEINPVFEQAVERTFAELSGKDFWSELSSLKGTVFQSEFEKAMRERRPVHFEGLIPQKDSWFEVHAYPRDHTLEVYLRDISARKHAEHERMALIEREQEARKQAEAANSAKDEFLAVLSHELRTPLNTIIGWTQLIRNGTLTPVETSRALEVMYRNAQAQRRLIEDLIDISRIVSGKMKVETKPVNLAVIVAAVAENMKPTAAAKGIELRYSSPGEATPVLADSGRIQQVLNNIISNAIKFTPMGGAIFVNLAVKDDHVVVDVKDTGKGIDPEFLPHIFERFRQEDNSSTRRFSGLGLGLAIARNVVEMHGGTIHAASEGEGKGATFSIELPLQREGNIATPSRTAVSKTALHRVVMVDDDVDGSEPLALLLSVNGVQVDFFKSATEALAKLPGMQPPAAIISDIAMPEMDGIEFMKRLRNLPGYEGIPSIAISAYDTPDYVQKCLAGGFNQYLSKPVAVDTLISTINKLVPSK